MFQRIKNLLCLGILIGILVVSTAFATSFDLTALFGSGSDVFSSTGAPAAGSQYVAKQYFNGPTGQYPPKFVQCKVDLKTGAVSFGGEVESYYADKIIFTSNPAKLSLTGKILDIIAMAKKELPLSGDCSVGGPANIQYWYLDDTDSKNDFMFKEICPPKQGLEDESGDVLGAFLDAACPSAMPVL